MGGFALPKIIYPSQPTLPLIPTLSSVAAGALAGATYYIVLTYTTPYGETPVGPEDSIVIAVNHVFKVASPPQSVSAAFATGYNIYASTSAGTETLQNTLPIDIGTDWQEPTGGLVVGSTPPASWGTTLLFQRQPRLVPSFTFETIRHDNRASSGVQETIFERTDEFLRFDMEYIAIGSDIVNWQEFIRSAIQGLPFDYYPDSSLTPFTTYFFDEKNSEAKYKFPGQYDMKLNFFQRVVWP